MIRVIRIRTIVEDRAAKMNEDSAYIEGCEAIIKAEKYFNESKVEIPGNSILKAAKALPANTPEEKDARHEAIKQAKKTIAQAQEHNEEIEIAKFVMHEIHRFESEFGQKQLELCRLIVSGGYEHFYDCAEDAMVLAAALPTTHIKEERTWRKQEIRNARALLKSRRLAAKHYPNGIVEYDPQVYEDAYNLPDDTSELAKVRRKAMRKASADKNLYATVAAPYLAAVRTLELAEGYADLDSITSDYDDVISKRNARHDAERAEAERVAEERRRDRETREAQKKLRK